MLCCVCNGHLPSYPSSTAKSPHRKLRKSLNTCYRFPKDEGVNILWMQIEKRGEMIRCDPLTKVPSYVFVTCKFPTCRPIWYLRSVPVCENASVHQQQQQQQNKEGSCNVKNRALTRTQSRFRPGYPTTPERDGEPSRNYFASRC
jgi:hypothetical protein